MTALYQTELPEPISTSPITAAVGATKVPSPMRGVMFCKDFIMFSVCHLQVLKHHFWGAVLHELCFRFPKVLLLVGESTVLAE